MLDILIVLVVFSGLIFGYWLKKIVKQEIKEGKKLIEICGKIILFLLVIIFLYGIWENYLIILGFILGFFILGNVYFYLGLGLFLSGFNFLVALLIFIYGLFFGSLNLKKVDNACLYFFWFFLPFVLFFWKHVENYDYLILSFVAGALFRKIFK